MNGGRRTGQVVPGQMPAATAYNAAGLLATTLVGAGLVHLLAYHLPPGVPSRRSC